MESGDPKSISHSALLDALYQHGQLAGCLRLRSRPLPFYIGAFQAWRCSTPLRLYDIHNRPHRELFLRCCCVALSHLIQTTRRLSYEAVAAYAGPLNDIKSEMIQSSQDWLNCMSDLHDDHAPAISILDSYDVANVALSCALLYIDNTVAGQDQPSVSSVTGILAQGVAVLGDTTSRRPALRPLRKVLTICSRALQPGTTNTPRSSFPENYEILSQIPRPLADMAVECCLGAGATMS